jgi:UDP-3-O-[3-hydroxymyristoyl] glucosamine N-acyltransferase
VIKVRHSFEEVANIVSPVEIVGTMDCAMTGIEPLSEATSSDLSLLGNKTDCEQLGATRTSIVLIGEDVNLQPRKNLAFMACKNPSCTLDLLCRDIEQKSLPKKFANIHGSAMIAASAQLGQNVYVRPYTIVEDDTEIGDGGTLDAGCYVSYGITIGNGSRLHIRAKVMPFVSLAKHYPGSRCCHRSGWFWLRGDERCP